MNEQEKIGFEIKRRRKLLKITQSDLAEISEVSLRSLKDIENGKGNPTIIQLVKLLDTLGLEIKLKSKKEYD